MATIYNVLLVGEGNVGKSSFLEYIRINLSSEIKKNPSEGDPSYLFTINTSEGPQQINFSTYLDRGEIREGLRSRYQAIVLMFDLSKGDNSFSITYQKWRCKHPEVPVLLVGIKRDLCEGGVPVGVPLQVCCITGEGCRGLVQGVVQRTMKNSEVVLVN